MIFLEVAENLRNVKYVLCFRQRRQRVKIISFHSNIKTQVRRGVKVPLRAVFGTTHGSVLNSGRPPPDEEIMGLVGSRSGWRSLIP